MFNIDTKMIYLRNILKIYYISIQSCISECFNIYQKHSVTLLNLNQSMSFVPRLYWLSKSRKRSHILQCRFFLLTRHRYHIKLDRSASEIVLYTSVISLKSISLKFRITTSYLLRWRKENTRIVVCKSILPSGRDGLVTRIMLLYNLHLCRHIHELKSNLRCFNVILVIMWLLSSMATQFLKL